MTREEALDKVQDAVGGMRTDHLTNAGAKAWDRHGAEVVLRAIEALGLIKFDEPKTIRSVLAAVPYDACKVWTTNGRYILGDGHAASIEDELAKHGYKIVRA